MTLPPELRERFLPSVDRLDDSMHAARRAYDDGDLDAALGHVAAALKLKPEYDAAWLLRGHVLRRARDSDGAVQSFAQALKINGESEEAWMGLASALHDLGRLDEEIEAYDRVLALRPRALEAWIDKGAALHDRKDYRGAIACYDKVLALRPEDAAAWNNKGAALVRLRDASGAATCFDEALHLDPDFYDAIVNRILLYEKQGRPGEVVLWADRALRIREASFLWYMKGIGHLRLLESTLALRAFERALSLEPGMKEARAALRKAKALHEKVDVYRGVYECFGTHLPGDPGCEECEIRARCREVTP